MPDADDRVATAVRTGRASFFSTALSKPGTRVHERRRAARETGSEARKGLVESTRGHHERASELTRLVCSLRELACSDSHLEALAGRNLVQCLLVVLDLEDVGDHALDVDLATVEVRDRTGDCTKCQQRSQTCQVSPLTAVDLGERT